MGKARRYGGAEQGPEPSGDLLRGRRVVIRDGSVEFSATDGGAPDTVIRRSGAGVVSIPGLALTGDQTVAGALTATGTLTALGYLAVGANAGVTGALDVSGTCSGISGPRDRGLIAETGNPNAASGLVLLTGGTIYLSKMWIPRDATPTKLYWYVTTGATTATASQCWVSVLSSAGAVLATPVDVATASESSGLKTTTVAPGALSAGTFVWGAIVCAAVALPTLAGEPATALATLTNVGLTAATYAHATNGTSQTTITTRTPASNTAGDAIWMGLGA